MIEKNESPIQDKVALISTPWPDYYRPSIQLGALKAYLATQHPTLQTDAYHFYLNIAEHIGYDIYHEICEKSWLAESIYAALVFPENKDAINKFFCIASSDCKEVRTAGFDRIVAAVKEISDKLIESISWDHYMLIGFSVCLCQLSSALYFINKVKEISPHSRIAAGGTALTGLSQKKLFDAFPQINYFINGEGEKPLLNLVTQLVRNMNGSDVKSSPGLYIKDSDDDSTLFYNQVKDLDGLPPPNYDDYFLTLEKFHPSKRFFPTLSVEVSRGCWWSRKVENTEETGCAFCNLNRQWKGYRSKSPKKAVDEVNMLTSKYKSLSVSFMDNTLPFKTSDEMFSRLAKLDKDLSLFCEIRATTSKASLEKMKKAGVLHVQVGIEALSSNLLCKMNKGTTAIQNLEIMRSCEELGLVNSSNLIIHFPGSSSHDVAETISCLDYAVVFRPMKTVHFHLNMGSPMMKNPEVFGIKAIYNHPNFKILFSRDIVKSIRSLNQAYRSDLGYQRKLWKPVEEKVMAWEKKYARLHSEPMANPILSYQDGNDFLIIKHRQNKGKQVMHRLVGPFREIYLFCGKHRLFKDIKNRFPKLAGSTILLFLLMLINKKFMFEEDGKYLSLAVRCREKRH